jgi:hypothetical protein
MLDQTCDTNDGLRRCAAFWRNYPPDVQEAVADCITLPYVLKSTKPEQFAAERGLALGTDDFDAAWASFLSEYRAMQKNAYQPNDIVYTIYVRRPDGTPLALGTIMWVTGTRSTPIGAAIGDPESSLPTFRMLQWPGFPVGLGIDPQTTPEAHVAELGRLVLRRKHELADYVTKGQLRQEAAGYLATHGSSELQARIYFCGKALAGHPVALVANTPRRLARWLNRIGMRYQPLYLQGAEPTPRTLGGPPMLRGYFTWGPLVSPHVPARVLAQGISAAIRYLATTQPEVLDSLQISLPHLNVVDDAFERSMAELIATCGLQPLPFGLAALVHQQEQTALVATR